MNILKSLKLTLFLGLLLAAVPAGAQKKATVNVYLRDEVSGEPVDFANVSIASTANAEKDLFFALSDISGKAVIKDVPYGDYKLTASLLGYESKEVQIKVDKAAIALDTLRMAPSTEQLEAATVSAIGNQIIVKKDTVEYNTSSYVMAEDDMLEDLLKKLPGVEVDENGAITVNGDKVTKIMIDGKKFFLNDPKLASQNILAKYIKNLRVIDKKSDQAEFTGIDDGERETVIDISVTEEMGKGLSGNANFGVGHDFPGKSEGLTNDHRLQGNGMISQFTKDRQLSLIINANNTNDRSTQGGGDDAGITTKHMLGANASGRLCDGKMDLSGNYVLNNKENNLLRHTDRQSFMSNRTLDYSSDETRSSNTLGNSLGTRLEHKFSPASSIIFDHHMSYNIDNDLDASESKTFNVTDPENTRQTNEANRSESSKSKAFSMNGSFMYRQRLGIPGRTLIFYTRYNFSDSNTDGLNNSLTRTFRNNGSYRDSIINQRYESEARRVGLSQKVTYTEPIGSGFYLEANYTFSWNRTTSFKNAFNNDPESEMYGEFLKRYSNDIKNNSISNRAGANVKFQNEKWKAQVGISVVPTQTKNTTTKRGIQNTIETNVVNWTPQFSVSYDPKQNTSLRASYFGSTNQPSPSQLMPVPNVGNPLFVNMGNPYLLPSFKNALNLTYRTSNKKKFWSVNLRLTGNLTYDPIVNAIWYDTNGIQYTMPVNGKYSYDTNFYLTFNVPFGKTGLTLSGTTNASYNSRYSFLGEENIDLDAYYTTGEFDYEKFHEDYKNITEEAAFKKNLTQTVTASQRLRLNYRWKDLEIATGGRTRYTQSWYTIKEDRKPIWNNNVNGSVNYRWRKIGLSCDAQVNYNWYRGYASPVDDEIVLNARIAQNFLKNSLTLAIQGFDLLGQAKALSVSDSTNQHREVMSNTLGRYVIVSLSYRFRKMPGGTQQRSGSYQNNRYGSGGGSYQGGNRTGGSYQGGSYQGGGR